MLAAKIPQRTICEQLHMGRGVLNRYKPAFNDAAVEWVAYYDTSLQTCRIRTPRDKGPVEGLVQKAYNAAYALLHDEVFYNLLNNYSVPYQYVGLLVPLAVIAWYRLQRYVWYRYSAIVT